MPNRLHGHPRLVYAAGNIGLSLTSTIIGHSSLRCLADVEARPPIGILVPVGKPGSKTT